MKLPRKDFRRWLESKSPKAVVGTRGSLCGCPLARYLSSLSHVGYVAVCTDDIYWFDVDEDRPHVMKTPLWAENFISHVDESGPVNRKVTAATALKLLD